MNVEITNCTAVELVKMLINAKWNCTSSTGKISVILKLLSPEKPQTQGLKELKSFLEEREQKLGKNEFSYYYGEHLIDVVKELLERHYKEDGKILNVNQTIRSNMPFDIYFNWKNYDILLSEELLPLISNFDDNFRGDIQQIHRVYNSKYIIIETKQKEDKILVNRFYIKTQHEMLIETYSFRTFEDALLYSMTNGTHYAAMATLYHDATKQL